MLSKKCLLCTSWESRKNTDDYERFINVIRDSHTCSINHDGSAGSMEVKGIWNVLRIHMEYLYPN